MNVFLYSRGVVGAVRGALHDTHELRRARSRANTILCVQQPCALAKRDLNLILIARIPVLLFFSLVYPFRVHIHGVAQIWGCNTQVAAAA